LKYNDLTMFVVLGSVESFDLCYYVRKEISSKLVVPFENLMGAKMDLKYKLVGLFVQY
jgi:predicted cupin superfamily sugar epimerase